MSVIFENEEFVRQFSKAFALFGQSCDEERDQSAAAAVITSIGHEEIEVTTADGLGLASGEHVIVFRDNPMSGSASNHNSKTIGLARILWVSIGSGARAVTECVIADLTQDAGLKLPDQLVGVNRTILANQHLRMVPIRNLGVR